MVGEYIKKLRTQKKLSLRELAKRANISHSIISLIENNLHHPTRDMVASLAKGLDVPAHELERLAGYLPQQTDEPKEPYIINNDTLRHRIQTLMETQNISIQQIALTCSINPQQLESWLQSESADNPLSLAHVYKLAQSLDVTPDFLYGYTNSPNGYDPRAPRPKNLLTILESEDIIFDDIPLDDHDKQKLIKIIYAVFGNE